MQEVKVACCTSHLFPTHISLKHTKVRSGGGAGEARQQRSSSLLGRPTGLGSRQEQDVEEILRKPTNDDQQPRSDAHHSIDAIRLCCMYNWQSGKAQGGGGSDDGVL